MFFSTLKKFVRSVEHLVPNLTFDVLTTIFEYLNCKACHAVCYQRSIYDIDYCYCLVQSHTIIFHLIAWQCIGVFIHERFWCSIHGCMWYIDAYCMKRSFVPGRNGSEVDKRKIKRMYLSVCERKKGREEEREKERRK